MPPRTVCSLRPLRYATAFLHSKHTHVNLLITVFNLHTNVLRKSFCLSKCYCSFLHSILLSRHGSWSRQGVSHHVCWQPPSGAEKAPNFFNLIASETFIGLMDLKDARLVSGWNSSWGAGNKKKRGDRVRAPLFRASPEIQLDSTDSGVTHSTWSGDNSLAKRKYEVMEGAS